MFSVPVFSQSLYKREVKVSDPDGLSDVASVNWQIVSHPGYRVERLRDNGKRGDTKEGDGIFSFERYVQQVSETGEKK